MNREPTIGTNDPLAPQSPDAGRVEEKAEKKSADTSRGRAQIAEELQEADRVLEEIASSGDIQAALATVSEDSRADIQSLMERFAAGAGLETEEYERLATTLGPTVMERMAAFAKVLQRSDELQKELLPFRKDEVRQLGDFLESSIDYAALLRHFEDGWAKGEDGSNTPEYLTSVMFTVEAIRKAVKQLHTSDPNLDTCNGIERSLEELRAQLQSFGVLREAPMKEAITFSEAERDVLVAKLENAAPQIRNFRRLAGTYRGTAYLLGSEAGSGEDRGLSQILEVIKTHDCSPAFLQAADAQVDKKIKQYKREGRISRSSSENAEERSRIESLDIKELATKIQINGFEVPPGMQAVVTPEELKEQLILRCPPDFLENFQSINFIRPENRPKERDEEGARVETQGSYFEITEESGVTRRIEMYVPFFVSADAGANEKILAKHAFFETFWHEMGHNAHRFLTGDEMQKFEDTLQKDPVAVTWYVKHSRKKTEETGKREDFCESMSLFMNNPTLLYILSESRFNYMTFLFSQRSQTPQIARMLRIAQQGTEALLAVMQKEKISVSDLRDMYLSHEKETN